MAVAEQNAQETSTGSQPGPIILYMGKRPRKRIKALKEGKGKLLTEVMEAVEELRATGNIAQDAQPVIVVVSEKLEMGNIFPKISL